MSEQHGNSGFHWQQSENEIVPSFHLPTAANESVDGGLFRGRIFSVAQQAESGISGE